MKKILSIANTVIAAALSLLGCSLEGPVEYGTPSADFIINGKASSHSGKPVKNIAVVMRQNLGTDNEGRPVIARTDSTGTDNNGNYRVKDQHRFPQAQTYQLTFSDIDGEENGAFKDTTLTVEFNNPQFAGGDGRWYSGETSKEANIQLRPEE
ncbi:MAG: radical SAM-associated putative lipoprotein [Prevotellaceae bacterium]|jgi:putative lipoprotein (rSAM/lipoprotein system)|nr:radical SAM-associated putative lipoprotein [Prevotellaceae bacterium]